MEDLLGRDGVLATEKEFGKAVFYLRNDELVHRALSRGITVENIFLQMELVTAPTQRIVLGHVKPFIPNEDLLPALARLGQERSEITAIRHKFRRRTLRTVISLSMQLEKVDEVEGRFTVRHEGVDYQVYWSSERPRCHACGEVGHFRRDCPSSRKPRESTSGTSAPASSAPIPFLLLHLCRPLTLSLPVPIPTPVPAPDPVSIPVPIPTPVPAPDPVSTPVPIPTPVPAPDPVSIPVPIPTPVPAPDPVSIPVPIPTPVPAPDPVSTPVPIPTPVLAPDPVSTPVPIPTPVPAPDPVSTPVPIPTPVLAPAPAPVDQAGDPEATCREVQARDGAEPVRGSKVRKKSKHMKKSAPETAELTLI
ncbi:uncharacterized protein [Hemitrygon akajei]|uniref:uncharacterized protein n=1 Tax=Hemitrygon akajei TaxID=2704970 RepID=UPI003BF96341